MPLFLVRSKKGAAIVLADSEMDAKINTINTCYVDAGDLLVAEFDPEALKDMPNGVFEFKSFENGEDLDP